MNGAARRCRKQLEALGFHLDAEHSAHNQQVWRHPNGPRQSVKVYGRMKDGAASTKIERARQIADLSTTVDGNDTIRERTKIRRQDERQRAYEDRLRHEHELAPFQATADDRARRMAEERRIRDSDRRRRDIERLMRPVGGR